MKGCPYCEQLKGKLKEERFEFIERDIEENSEEYDLFVEITENEYVPAFMIIEDDENNQSSKLFAPERDFNTLDEGIEIIKKEIL
jgi:glutaredoxin